MTLPLPNLDDRRWDDLVEEGRALIPFYAPDWTDHNLHDPGIMLLELFAWLAEQDLFELNQVTDRQRRKLLALAGVGPAPVRPARTILNLELRDVAPRQIAAGLEFSNAALPGDAVRFRAIHDLEAIPGAIFALQTESPGSIRNLTGAWKRREALLPFGDDPRRGSAFMIGIAPVVPWQPGWKASLGVLIDGEPSGESDHHGAQLIWETQNAFGTWVRAEVNDGTRALTHSGRIEITPADPPSANVVGAVGWPLIWLRVRIASGRPDDAPVLRGIAFNAVEVEQAVPSIAWVPIAKGAALPAGPAPIGDWIDPDFDLDRNGSITRLAFTAPQPDRPPVRLIAWNPDGRVAGFEALAVGSAHGAPSYTLESNGDPLVPSSATMTSFEGGAVRVWEHRADFDASRRSDAHIVVESASGRIVTGDGERGRTVPAGAIVVATADRSRGAGGNLAADSITAIADSPRNQALFSVLVNDLPFARVSSLGTTTNGADEETVRAAIVRARRQREAPLRAVTLDDHVALALATPGARLARAEARANFHPGFPCLSAPGIVTVLILPWLPNGRPEPTAGLRRLVANWLDDHRVIGTRIEVAGPVYVPVSVVADVMAHSEADPTIVAASLSERIDQFLDPLIGGPDGSGWPFGRNVYRSEILQVIDETPGVLHVRSLELVDRHGVGSCGNLCVGPLGLPESQPHSWSITHWRSQ